MVAIINYRTVSGKDYVEYRVEVPFESLAKEIQNSVNSGEWRILTEVKSNKYEERKETVHMSQIESYRIDEHIEKPKLRAV